MEKISLRFHRLIYKLKHSFSPENIVLIIAVCLCLFWTYQSISSMSRNWTLAENLSAEKAELELLQLEVEAAELENDYYKTDEYQEIAARKYTNKQLEGEHLVYLPANSEQAKNKHQTTTDGEENQEYSNFEKWLRFLFPNNS